MNMTRRGFLAGCLAAGVAPLIVKAEGLMRIAKPTQGLILPLGIAGVVREIRAYDIRMDAYLWRWDVVGDVGGELRQYHVGLMEDDRALCEPLVAAAGRALYVTAAQPSENNRRIALDCLRSKIESTGMRPVSGVLDIPDAGTGVVARLLA